MLHRPYTMIIFLYRHINELYKLLTSSPMSPWAVTLSWQHSYISIFVIIHKPSKLGQTELVLVCDRSSLAVPVCMHHASVYVERLWFLRPWLTHRHTQTAFDRLASWIKIHVVRFWPPLCMAHVTWRQKFLCRSTRSVNKMSSLDGYASAVINGIIWMSSLPADLTVTDIPDMSPCLHWLAVCVLWVMLATAEGCAKFRSQYGHLYFSANTFEWIIGTFSPLNLLWHRHRSVNEYRWRVVIWDYYWYFDNTASWLRLWFWMICT